jgi:hypothetical protein
MTNAQRVGSLADEKVVIPAFVDVGQPDEVLPPGLHQTNELEIKATLVDKFPGSTSRSDIFTSWQAFSLLCRSILPVKEERINGSFVTSRLEPSDLDVAIWIAADDFAALDLGTQLSFGDLLAKAKPTFKCDAYVVPECPPGHPTYADYQYMLWTDSYWAQYKSPTKLIVPGVQKGYLRVAR